MSAPPPPPPPAAKGGGMSLYANLLNPKGDGAASISGAPVLYDNKDDAAAKKDINPALRFQPIRRPQAAQKKTAKPGFPKAIPPSANPTAISPPSDGKDPSGTTNTTTATSAPSPAAEATRTPPPGHTAQPARTTLADWAANDEDEYLWGVTGEKRQRGGRRAAKKKKNKQLHDTQRETDWDEIYDPARPTNVEEYMRSDERIREVQEWKAVLYAHRRRRRGSYDEEDSEEDSVVDGRGRPANQFAPPAEYSFAPPPMSPSPPPAAAAAAAAAAGAASPPARDSPAVAHVPDDATGDDAYARRLAMSGMGSAATAVPPPPTTHTPTPPPPPPAEDTGATISRGPVRYEAPPQPSSTSNPPPVDSMDLDDDDDNDDDVNIDNIILPPGPPSTDPSDDQPQAPSSNRPGQAGFAQRLMSKYGWTAGSGLGASSSGIVKPLQVKVEKRRRRPDAEGGGFAEPGGRGKVIAPTANATASAAAAANDPSKFGPMSSVILLANMLQNMPDLESEIANGGLGQEIGQECGDKYGRIERLYIDVEGKQVFIKFTDTVSALRAVNALEGRVFNGNVIAAQFWNEEKFERGEYT